jgi:hypothetical protein
LPIAILGVIAMGGASFWMQRTRRRKQADTDIVTHSLRWGLVSALAGLLGYVLYGAGLVSAPVKWAFGAWGALMVVLTCGAVPLIVGWRKPDLKLRIPDFKLPGANRK